MNNGRTKNGITHRTMKILHGRRTNVKCTEARLQKEEMECNKVKRAVTIVPIYAL